MIFEFYPPFYLLNLCYDSSLQKEFKCLQHSTAQHSTAQHSTAQHSTAQHSTAQHSSSRA
ncbi:MAG: hypothetical protein LBU73_03005 [Helicobacteraceae bacterium]|nr:hypothetical protein [Helicobacteraceae bacterium]